ncbi:flagellar basal body P-ring formation chaperone FlgA [Nitrospira sp. M1]
MKRIIICSVFMTLVNFLPIGEAWAKAPMQKPTETQRVAIRQFHETIMKDLHARITSPDMKIDVQVLFPKTSLEVPAGRLTLEVQTNRLSHLTGRRAFRVQIMVDSKPIKTVNIVASVSVRTDVLTPVRWIKMHEVLTAKDVMKTTVNLRTFHQDIVMDPTDIIGKRATRALPPHQPFRASFVAEPLLVHKGDRVMIEVRRGGLFVQTLGVAKASGQSGELISVTNQTSGRDVLATVLSAGVVEVRF